MPQEYLLFGCGINRGSNIRIAHGWHDISFGMKFPLLPNAVNW
jgi:hypothetical protein